MSKELIKTEFFRRYLRNESLEEFEVLKESPDFFKSVLEEYGTWHKFEKEVGILNRHIKERERYFLYVLMRERQKRFGKIALRHKYIEEELKGKIADSFGTVRRLTKEILENDCQDRVLFDSHTFFLTGGLPSNIAKEQPELFNRILNFFPEETDFYSEYEKRFLIQPLTLEDEKENSETSIESQTLKTEQTTPRENNKISDTFSSNGPDLDTLVSIGYMSKEQAENIKLANSKTKEEVFDFVLKLPSDYTSETLQKENPIMWIAINKEGGLDSVKAKINEFKKMLLS